MTRQLRRPLCCRENHLAWLRFVAEHRLGAPHAHSEEDIAADLVIIDRIRAGEKVTAEDVR